MPAVTATPIHDALCAWVAANEGLALAYFKGAGRPTKFDAEDARSLRYQMEQVERVRGYDRELTDWERKHETQAQAETETANRLWAEGPPEGNDPRVEAVEWERPVVNPRNGTIIGYLDLCVTVDYGGWVLRRGYGASTYSAATWSWEWDGLFADVVFEVKPSIPSLGAVIRQVQKYRHWMDHGRVTIWVVVTPEVQYEGVLETQGIKLLCPPAGLLSASKPARRTLPPAEQLALETRT
jgi:hypothetical protein